MCVLTYRRPVVRKIKFVIILLSAARGKNNIVERLKIREMLKAILPSFPLNINLFHLASDQSKVTG